MMKMKFLILLHTEYQLANVIKSNKVNLAVVSVQLHDEMMKDAGFAPMKQNNQPQFWSLYQMNLWKTISKRRQHIRI